MIIPLNPSVSIVDENDLMTETFQAFMLQVSEMATVVGTGTPEGVLYKQQGVFYVDDAGGAGTTVYVKQLEHIAGDRTKGWVAI